MHETYFAVAKAQWRCGALSAEMLRKVREIVESGRNVELMAELGLTPAERKTREKNLRSFLASLQTPPARPHKRPKLKNLPDMRVGDCYRFSYKSYATVFVVLDMVKYRDCGRVLCCYFKNTEIGKEVNFADEKISTLIIFRVKTFRTQEHTKLLGHIELPENLREKLFARGDRAEEGFALSQVIYKDGADVTLGDLLRELRFDLPDPEKCKLYYEKIPEV